MKYHLVYRNGRYDPILSDLEPKTETIHQGTSDHPSQAVEVFLEVPSLIEITNLTERDSVKSLKHTTKKFRPFSIERYNEILQKTSSTSELAYNTETFDINNFGTFKLPISDLYDPEGGNIDWRRMEQRVNEKIKEIKTKKETQNKRCFESESFKTDKDESEPFEDELNDLREDLKITARKIVTESLKKAVLATEEIVSDINSGLKVENEIKKLKDHVLPSSKITGFQEENVMLEVMSDIPKSVKETVQLYETIDTEAEMNKEDERKLFLLQEIEESIEQGYVRRKSSIFENKMKCNVKDRQIRKSAVRKAYSIGTETITHIKRAAESSLSNSLLKIFFFYLTNIMVSLTRYIPKHTFQFHNRSGKDKHEFSTNLKIEDHHEAIRRRKLSSADIAQLVSRKPKDLTERMDTVVSEFHSKLNINNRRAKSCSRIDEVTRSNTFEWLSGMDEEDREQVKKEIKLATLEAARRVLGRRRSYHNLNDVENEKIDCLTYIAIVESHVYTNKNAIFDDNISHLKAQVKNNLDITNNNEMEIIAAECLSRKSYQFLNNRDIYMKNNEEVLVTKDQFIDEEIGQRIDYVATVTVEHKQIPSTISIQQDETTIEINKLAINEKKSIIDIESEVKQMTTELEEKIEKEDIESCEAEEVRSTPVIEEMEIDKRIHQATVSQTNEVLNEIHNNLIEITEVKEESPLVSLESKKLIGAQAVGVETIEEVKTILDKTQDGILTITELKEETPIIITEEEKLGKANILNKETIRQSSDVFSEIDIKGESYNLVGDKSILTTEADNIFVAKMANEAYIYEEPTKLTQVEIDSAVSAKSITEECLLKTALATSYGTLCEITSEYDTAVIAENIEIKEEISMPVIERKELTNTQAVSIATARQISEIFNEILNDVTIPEVTKELPTIALESESLEKPIVFGKDVSRQISAVFNILEVNEEIENHNLIEEKAVEVIEKDIYATAKTINYGKTEEIDTIISQLDVDSFSIDETKEEFAKVNIEIQEFDKIQPISNATASHVTVKLEESEYFETNLISELIECQSFEVMEEIVRLHSISYATMQDIMINTEEIAELPIKKIDEEVASTCFEPQDFHTVISLCISVVTNVMMNLYEVKHFDIQPVKEEVANENLEVDVFSFAQSKCTEILQEIRILIEEVEEIHIDMAPSEVATAREEDKLLVTTFPVATPFLTQLNIMFTEVDIIENEFIPKEQAIREEEKRDFYLSQAICCHICQYKEVTLEEYNSLEVDKIIEELASTCDEPQVFENALSICTSTFTQITTIYFETEALKEQHFQEERAESSEEKNIYSIALSLCSQICRDIILLLEESNEFNIDKVEEEFTSVSVEPCVLEKALSHSTSSLLYIIQKEDETQVLEIENVEEAEANVLEEVSKLSIILATCIAAMEVIYRELEECKVLEIDKIKEESSNLTEEPFVLVRNLPICISVLGHVNISYNYTENLDIDDLQEEKADTTVEVGKFITVLCFCTEIAGTIKITLEEIKSFNVDEITDHQAVERLEPDVLCKTLALCMASVFILNVPILEVNYREADIFQPAIALSSLEMKEFLTTQALSQATVQLVDISFKEVENTSINYEVKKEYAKLSSEAAQLNATYAVSRATTKQLDFNYDITENYETAQLELEKTNCITESRDFTIAETINNATVLNEYLNLHSVKDNHSCNFEEDLAIINIEPKHVKTVPLVKQTHVHCEDNDNKTIKSHKETVSLNDDAQFVDAQIIKQVTLQDTNSESLDIKELKDDVTYEKVAIIEEPVYLTKTKASSKSFRRKHFNTHESSNVIDTKTINAQKVPEIKDIIDNKRITIEAEPIIEKLTERSVCKENVNNEANLHVSISKTKAKKDETHQDMSYNLTLIKPQDIEELISETQEENLYIKKKKGLKHHVEEFQEEVNLTSNQDVEETGVIIQEITDLDEIEADSIDLEAENKSMDMSLEVNVKALQKHDASEDLYETATLLKQNKKHKKFNSNQEESAALTIVKKEDIVFENPVIDKYEEENSITRSDYMNKSEIVNSQASKLEFQNNLHKKIVDQTQMNKRLSQSNIESLRISHKKDVHEEIIGNEFTHSEIRAFESDINDTIVCNTFEGSVNKSSILKQSNITSTFSNQEFDSKAVNKKSRSLTIETNLKREKTEGTEIQYKDDSSPEIESPTKPPTPLTDEYIFRLVAPLPKSRGSTPIPREPSPQIIKESEDLDVNKKNLVPTIEAVTIERVVYNPPLPTPPTSPVHSPTYTKPGLNGGMKRLPRYVKPGLRGGSDRPPIPKEEILEVRQNLSILTSDINETLKNIEKYKKLVEILKQQKAEGEGSSKIMEEETANKLQDVQEKEISEQHSVTETRIDGSSSEPITDKIPNEDFVEINLKDKIENVITEVRDESPKRSEEAEERNMRYNIKEVTSFEEIEKDYENTGIVELAPETAAENDSNEKEQTAKKSEDTAPDTPVIDSDIIKEDKEHEKSEDKAEEISDEEQKAADREVARVIELSVDTEISTTKETSPIVTTPREDILKEAHVISLTKVLSSHMLREGLSPDCQKMKDKFENQNILEDGSQKTGKEDRSWTTFLQKSTQLPSKQKLGHFTDIQNKFENQEHSIMNLSDRSELRIFPKIKPRDFNASPVPWQERAVADTLGAPGIPTDERELIQGEKPEFFLAIPIESKDNGDTKCTVVPLPHPNQQGIPNVGIKDALNEERKEEIIEEIINEAVRVVDSLEIGAEKNKRKEKTLHSEDAVKYEKEKLESKENTAVEISKKEIEKSQNIKEEETKKVTEMPAETKGELLVKDKKPSFGPQIQEQQKTSSRPQQKFGWMKPEPRPLKLPGGRRWRRPGEEYSEEQIAETILAHSELIQGKTMGINFMKYERPPPPLDHLQHSEVYKLIHNVDQTPPKRVDFLRTAIAEADYRERCRSLSPCPPESNKEQKSAFSLQLQP